MSIFEKLYEYGAHDCTVNNIFCSHDNIIFSFDSGVYKLSDSGAELDLTNSCRLIVEINVLPELNIYNQIEVKQIRKKRLSEITPMDFFELVNKNCLNIENIYFSRFCNTLLLEGYSDSADYELILSEVKDVNYLFV